MKKLIAVSLGLAAITLFPTVLTVHAAVLAIISQPNGSVSWANIDLGQSFTATATGVVTTIRVAPGTSSTQTLRIYAGGGDAGTLLYSQLVTYSDLGGAFQTIILTSPVSVTTGQTYTFYVNGDTEVTFYDEVDGPYAGGSEWVGNGPRVYDLKFEVVIEDGLATSSGDKAPDDRINWRHGDDYAAIYARQNEMGDPVLHFYCIDAQGNGYLGAILTQEIFNQAPAKPAVNTKVGEIDICYVPIKYYVLTTGEYQVNIGPNVEGKVNVIIFTGLPPTQVYFKYFNLYTLFK